MNSAPFHLLRVDDEELPAGLLASKAACCVACKKRASKGFGWRRLPPLPRCRRRKVTGGGTANAVCRAISRDGASIEAS